MTLPETPKTPSGRASKGTVNIKSSNGRLQLCFRHGGKRHYVSTGLPDTKVNRAQATILAQRIWLDLISDNFDETKEKYKPQGTSAQCKLTDTEEKSPSVKEVWEKYCEAKKPSLKAGTWRHTYMVNTSHLSRCPYDSFNEAQQIFDWAIATLKPYPARRLIQALGGCCKWAMRAKLISSNPFDGMAGEIKIKKKEDDTEIDPFSKEERQQIIEAFAGDRHYKHYVGFVQFLFYTGCRPSEAIALQWKHITESQVIFEQAVVQSEYGLVLQKGLKSQERRKFPINIQLRELMESLTPDGRNPEIFIFQSPRGQFIDFHNFRNRAWIKILKKQGLRYRKPYQTRHTFITLCLENGITVQQVAKWVGNTPEVIMRHYAGTLAKVEVPEI